VKTDFQIRYAAPFEQTLRDNLQSEAPLGLHFRQVTGLKIRANTKAGMGLFNYIAKL
jgi:hypothetical protein